MPLLHQPRPYQEKALHECRQKYAHGSRSVLLVLPTGGGKTQVGAMIVDGAIKKERRVLWCAARRELIDQAAQSMPHEAGIIMAGRPVNPAAPIQVASVDTLRNIFEFPPADFVVVDEAHHGTNDTHRIILQNYPKAHLLGLTATPIRGDGTALGDVFQQLVLGPSVADLIRMGFLVLPDVIGPESFDSKLASDPVEAWLKYSEGLPGFVFAKTRGQSKEIVNALIAKGIRAAHVEAKTPKGERDDVVHKFRNGRIDVLSSVNVFTEGTDAPRAAVCMLASNVEFVGGYLQRVGRVLRVYPGKTKAIVIDLFGQVHHHGLPDDHRLWSLSGKASSFRDGAPSIRQCPQCGLCFSPGPDSCRRCGYVFPEPERPKLDERPLESLRDRLRPHLAQDEDTKRAKFEELCATAELKGYKAKWVGIRFQGLFGHWPKWKIELEAETVESEAPPAPGPDPVIPVKLPPGWWRTILGSASSFDEARSTYKSKARTAHPDVGGSEAMMQALNVAIEQCEKEMKR